MQYLLCLSLLLSQKKYVAAVICQMFRHTGHVIQTLAGYCVCPEMRNLPSLKSSVSKGHSVI